MSDGCAAMYVRVSTGGQSVETQNDAVVQAARVRGDRIARVYAEVAGGDARRRPELDRLMSDVRAGAIRRLYCYRLDRLSRAGIRATLSIVGELDHCGVELVTVADGFSVMGPARDVVIAVLAWAAQIERQAISERIAAARERIAAEGGAWGRPRREVDLDRVALLRQSGASVREISETLHVPRAIIGRAVKASEAGINREPKDSVPKTLSISGPSDTPKKSQKKRLTGGRPNCIL
jgi:DNA invertase Pin-like site-specific DNA recombinase